MEPLGIVLAAGAGRRYGGPKALVRDPDGRTWLERTCAVLLDGGCGSVLATVPAEMGETVGSTHADQPLLPSRGVTLLPLTTTGLSESLDAAVAEAQSRTADAVVVMLVDLPDVGPEVVRRVLAGGLDRATLRRASYDGRPGHPVLIGADHLAALRERLAGDTGANAYLRAHDTTLVECGDLATGRDVDRPR